MKTLWELFISFFSVGLFTFGGGYAMLPMLQKEVVERRGWATEQQLLDTFALAQCTPGVIAVNTATYIGYKTKNVLGSMVATFAVVLPSLIIITVIATVLRQFGDSELVRHAFAGIRVAVAALVIRSLIELYRKGVKGALGNGLFLATLLSMILLDVSPILPVAIAIALGVVFRIAGGRR